MQTNKCALNVYWFELNDNLGPLSENGRSLGRRPVVVKRQRLAQKLSTIFKLYGVS